MSLILLAFLRIGWAQSGPEAVGTLDRAQGKLGEMGAPPCRTCDVTQAGKPEPKWRQCFQAICPAGFGQINAREDEAMDKMSTLPPAIEAALRADVSANLRARLKALQEIRAALAQGAVIRDVRLSRMVRMNTASSLVGMLVVDESNQIQKDESRRRLPEVDAATFTDVITLKTLSLEYASKPGRPLASDYDFLIQKRSKSEITQEALQIMRTLPGQSEALERNYAIPKAFNLKDITPALRRRFESGKFTKTDVTTLKQVNEMTHVMNQIAEQKDWKSAPKNARSLRSYLTSQAEARPLEQVIDEYEERLKFYLDHPDHAPLEDDAVSTDLYKARYACRRAVAYARAFAPSEEQRQAFRTRVPVWRDTFVASLTPRLSAHSSSVLKRDVQGYVPAQPGTAETQLNDILAKLREDEDETNATLATEQNASDPVVRMSGHLSLLGSLIPFQPAQDV